MEAEENNSDDPAGRSPDVIDAAAAGAGMGRIALSWRRRQWLKGVAVVEDHPWTATVLVTGMVLFTGFYAFRLGGLAHFRESFARWRIESFGGVHEIDRAVRMYDVILSFKPRDYDRADVMSMSTFQVTGRAFQRELEQMVLGRGGRVRVVALDPRLADPDHENHEAFVSQARALGQEPWELGARCWDSTGVLLHLRDRLGEGFEVRLVNAPMDASPPPHFSIGRSIAVYRGDDPTERTDVIIPRPLHEGSDSLGHRTYIIRDRPESDRVRRFTDAFQSLWDAGTPMTGKLKRTLREQLDG